MIVKGTGFPKSEDKLGEERGEVVADARLGLGPKKRFRFEQLRAGGLRRNTEIDRAKNAGAVIVTEYVNGDFVLDFLFLELGIVGHLSCSVHDGDTKERALPLGLILDLGRLGRPKLITRKQKRRAPPGALLQLEVQFVRVS